MSDRKLTNLTRRKVLASVGALGAGAALGGAGTAAFFSDQETFANNELVAGSLDMVVDWQESYNGVNIEAFPDNDGTESNGDGTQDGYEDACTTLANVPADLNSDMRTNGTVSGTASDGTTVEEATEPGDPLLNLTDVKPGDWGEVTFSFHLCDNPGYVWMNGNLIENAENGFTEPEFQDPQEDGQDGAMDGELADYMQVTLWHDGDCSNTMDSGEYEIASGSLSSVIGQLSSGNGIPLDGAPGVDQEDDRDCYTANDRHCVALKWEVPPDHANEIQTDSVKFDLGFYTEQCRHNDGSGIEPEVIDTVEVTTGFGTNSGDTYSLVGDAGYPENMVTTVSRRSNRAVFELDAPKELDDSAGDNWALTFDADDDGTADFQVVYNNGFGYTEFNGSWGSAPMPPGIQTSIEDASDGRFVVEIPIGMLSSTFSFGGQLRYNGEEPGNPGQNFVVNITPGFSWGPGFNGDASSYYGITIP